MSFSYQDTLATNRDKVRFRVGDTQEDAGPRPDKRNFSDAEIVFVLSEEDSRVNGAIAHTFEILAAEWSAYALSEREGEVAFDAKEVANNYRAEAAMWRLKPGGADEEERSQSLVTMTRGDAWADNAASDYTPRRKIWWWYP